MQASKIMAISTYFLLLFIPYATASITFNFTNIGPRNLNQDIVIIGEGASISDEGIQLTPNNISSNEGWKEGRATYIKELHLWDKTSGELASFTTDFTFVIDSMNNAAYGDGLAFFLAKNTTKMYAGGSMGLPLNAADLDMPYPLVEVEFDTFWNVDWDPRNSSYGAVGDHVGININYLVSNTSLKWFSNIRDGRLCQAWISYDSVSKNISVSFTGFQNNTIVRQDLRYTIDLRTVLPERVIIGFSAATGGLLQINNVKSWAFNSSKLQDIDETNENNGLAPTSSPDVDLVKGENIIALVVGLIAGFAFLAVLAYFVWWRKKKSRGVEGGGLAEMNTEFEKGIGPRRFSYVELARSTGDFAEAAKLGEGSFGGVYKGFLKESNTSVAIKRVSKNSKQGIKEYAEEVRIISRLRHRNLVQLIGWCHEKGELLLVYEFMENASLDLHLFKSKSLLTWGTRYKIAHGLASSLLYLHEGWEQCVLHGDIKPSNVMLDLDFNAKLGDFGLAKFVDHDKSAQTTLLAGTLGYMAPETAVTGKQSKETDVFSFGVVALEIACGRKPIDYKAPQISLVEWVWELYGTGTLLEAADPRLRSDFEAEEIKCLMIVGLWCVNPESNLRPSMRQVIQVLNFEASLPTLPSKMPIATYLAPSMPSIVLDQSSSNDSSRHITSPKASPSVALRGAQKPDQPDQSDQPNPTRHEITQHEAT